ncbi:MULTISPECIES: hypothetical protein [unclassified Bartonella]|nr:MULTISPECIES: hypothetical protein [unclassified Bartonella]
MTEPQWSKLLNGEFREMRVMKMLVCLAKLGNDNQDC